MSESQTARHSEQPMFGRRAELQRWQEVLADPAGQAVLVVGHPGMGKTLLVNAMGQAAAGHPDYQAGFVRHEVTKTDTVDSILELMLDHAFQAAQLTEKSLDGTPRRLRQWKAFLNVFQIGDLVLSLRRDPKRSTRDQFIEQLELISKRMDDNGRAVFIVDPEKYMCPGSHESWAIVVRNLPPGVKLIFAQRPEDELARSGLFRGLVNQGHVVRIPDDKLDVLDEEAVNELINDAAGRCSLSANKLRKVVERYQRHPYAVPAALNLVVAGTEIDSLKGDPTPEGIAAEQWNKVEQGGANTSNGHKAVRLFEAYAVLEVPVPSEIPEKVSSLTSADRKTLLADPYLGPLLRTEPQGRRIYHVILADHIRDQLTDTEAEPYHRKAIDEYRRRLSEAKQQQTKPDALAAERLAEHVRVVEGDKAFVMTLVYECDGPLVNLGLLDSAQALYHQALEIVEDASVEAAALLGNLGLIYRTRGDLNQAETMYRKSLEISKKLGQQVGIASQYGNLGLIYETRGDLDQAEAMFRTALEINKKLGRQEGMAIQYGNLGLIHRKRGDLDQAEAMHLKSLKIEKKLGRLEGMANQYGNLGLIYRRRGNLDQAEVNFREVLKIEERLGRPESMANAYGNLGDVYVQRGDPAEARVLWTKSRDLYARIGMPHMVEQLEGWLASLEADQDGA